MTTPSTHVHWAQQYDAAVRRLLAGVAAAGLALAGCGKADTDQMVRTGTVPVQQKADGSLATNPVPLTVQDVDKQPAGSPRQAIMRLVFWAQWGNLPAIVDAYDSRIVATIGFESITDGYHYLRPELMAARPRVTAIRGSGRGKFIAIEFQRVGAAPLREGFFMVRRNGAWRIVYDTLLERAIEASTILRLGGEAPSASARRSGRRAATKYRNQYPSLLRAQRAEAAAPVTQPPLNQGPAAPPEAPGAG